MLVPSPKHLLQFCQGLLRSLQPVALGSHLHLQVQTFRLLQVLQSLLLTPCISEELSQVNIPPWPITLFVSALRLS